MYLEPILKSLSQIESISLNAYQRGELSSDTLSQLSAAIQTARTEAESLSHTLIDLRDYCDSYHQALCITDNSGTVIYANDAYLKFLKLTSDEVLGRPESFDDPISLRVIRTKKTITFGNAGSHRGLESGIFVAGIPIFDASGVLQYVAITLSTQDAVTYRYMELRRIMNLKESIRMSDSSDAGESDALLGRNKKIREIRALIKKIAPTDASVLITGDSGTGKEVVADSIYHLSQRRNKPFIKINCSAIPASLMEAELFGHEADSLVGANKKGKTGLLEMANGGTVLLDEIGDLPLELQPKLLRALQQQEIHRIGSDRPIKLDIRIICTTNSDLTKKVQAGQFLDDLYYRINVIPIQIPPLSKRREDIPGLIRHYMHIYCEKYQRTTPISPEAMALLTEYSWPGNIRELQNIIEYYVIVSDQDSVLSLEELKTILYTQKGQTPPPTGTTLIEKRDNYEKQLIEDAIHLSPSLRQAARRLGIHPSSLLRKLNKYGIAYKTN